MHDYKLYKRNEIIKELKEKNEIFEQYDIEVWVRPQQDYNIYIFTVILNDNKQLTESWERITNSIALNFQSELEKDIEIWNIYVVFLVNERVDKELKYVIEQDRYSSRKIVFDNFLSEKCISIDSHIQGLLDNKLFSFQLDQLKVTIETREELMSVEEMVKEMDAKLHQIIKYGKKNSKTKPENLLGLYMGWNK